MKKVILVLSVALLASCSKKQPEPIQAPVTPSVINTPIDSNRLVEIYITYGSLNNFCSVKWDWNAVVDSAYNNKPLNFKITNRTSTDSIYVYTNSYLSNQTPNTVSVYVNGLIKDTYTGVGVARVIKLN